MTESTNGGMSMLTLNDNGCSESSQQSDENPEEIVSPGKAGERASINSNVKHPSNAVNVKYQLNKEVSLSKKIAACDKIDYQVSSPKTCCIIQFNTATFEHFKSDFHQWVAQHPQYIHENDTPVIDMGDNIPQDIVRVISSIDSKPLFTVNMYRTKSKAMINGPEYKIFVNEVLPELLRLLKRRKEQSDQENRVLKGCLQEALSKERNASKVQCGDLSNGDVNLSPSKRARKKKTYDGFDIPSSKRMSTRSLVQGTSSKGEVNLEEKERRSWEERPKFWNKYGKGTWTKSVADQCNRSRCCLIGCGGNNTKDMIRCDGCGQWSHIKCIEQKDFDENDDFICVNCLQQYCEIRVQEVPKTKENQEKRRTKKEVSNNIDENSDPDKNNLTTFVEKPNLESKAKQEERLTGDNVLVQRSNKGRDESDFLNTNKENKRMVIVSRETQPPV